MEKNQNFTERILEEYQNRLRQAVEKQIEYSKIHLEISKYFVNILESVKSGKLNDDSPELKHTFYLKMKLLNFMTY